MELLNEIRMEENHAELETIRNHMQATTSAIVRSFYFLQLMDEN